MVIFFSILLTFFLFFCAVARKKKQARRFFFCYLDPERVYIKKNKIESSASVLFLLLVHFPASNTIQQQYTRAYVSPIETSFPSEKKQQKIYLKKANKKRGFLSPILFVRFFLSIHPSIYSKKNIQQQKEKKTKNIDDPSILPPPPPPHNNTRVLHTPSPHTTLRPKNPFSKRASKCSTPLMNLTLKDIWTGERPF